MILPMKNKSKQRKKNQQTKLEFKGIAIEKYETNKAHVWIHSGFTNTSERLRRKCVSLTKNMLWQTGTLIDIITTA